MSAQPTVVACSVCGTQLLIPAEYRNVAGKCRTCGSTVNQGPQLADSLFDLGIASIAPPRPVQAKPAPTPILERWKSNAPAAAMWGGIGALVGAAAFGSAFALVFIAAGVAGSETFNASNSFQGGAYFGLLAGFLFAGIWTLTVRMEFGIPMGALIGAAISLPTTMLHYFLEWYVIAPPDIPPHLMAVIGIGAGLFVGGISAWYRDYRDNL